MLPAARYPRMRLTGILVPLIRGFPRSTSGVLVIWSLQFVSIRSFFGCPCIHYYIPDFRSVEQAFPSFALRFAVLDPRVARFGCPGGHSVFVRSLPPVYLTGIFDQPSFIPQSPPALKLRRASAILGRHSSPSVGDRIPQSLSFPFVLSFRNPQSAFRNCPRHGIGLPPKAFCQGCARTRGHPHLLHLIFPILAKVNQRKAI